MPPTSELRPEVNKQAIDFAMEDLRLQLEYRLVQKGRGSYASRHEALGIITEEYQELIEAIRDDSSLGYDHYANEALDLAVAALFTYASIKARCIKPHTGDDVVQACK